MRILLRMRLSGCGLLLVPGAVLLFLVPLLLHVSLLYGSHRLGQRMRPMLRRLRTPVLGLSLSALLRLWSPLRLPHPRERFLLINSATRLAK